MMTYEASIKFLVVIALIVLQSPLCNSLHRWKRQSCSGTMFKCGSGECISAALVCDGERNCEDRSDETSETCINSVIPVLASYLNPPLISYVDKCPPDQFRCDNGNCIPDKKRCDSHRDCSDGSDEKECGNLCGSGEFKCGTGPCISSNLVCNGLSDCSDRSDETLQQCQSTRCSNNQFRCEYGACIPQNAVCDNKEHCADGSDENPALCKATPSPSTPPRIQSGCTLPLQPVNGMYHIGCESSSSSCNVPPGTIISNFAILNYTCSPGFKLSGQQIVWCNNEAWSSLFPTCNRALCPALVNPTRYFECSISGTYVNCSEPMVPGTKATIQCEKFHVASPELSNYDVICKENGRWSNVVYSCTPECGLPNPNGVPFVAGGRTVKLAEFPWHVGVYKMIGDALRQSCGGSIINSKVVVTAAHCFWNEIESSLFDVSSYRIAAGKFYIDWNKRTRYFQESEIERVNVRNFRGRKGLYAADIAVVILKTKLLINEAVRPICLDFDKKFSEDFKPGKNGVVVGWGYTENQTQSEELHAVSLPYEDRNVCVERTKESFIQFLNGYDKFCVGTNTGRSVCPGDSGGGFATKFSDGIHYYLMGIVSAGVVPEGNDECDISQYSSFTKVSEYYSFIKEFITV